MVTAESTDPGLELKAKSYKLRHDRFPTNVKERVVVCDDAMGTNIQFRNPGVDDFWGSSRRRISGCV